MSFKPKKVNPGLFVLTPCLPIPHISPFHQFLQASPLFGRGKAANDCQVWKAYPMFLKNSVFYVGANFEKYRKLEVGYKFFITDELREKGNMRYNKGRYMEALSFYEKAASLLQWLECTPDDFVKRMKEFPKLIKETEQRGGQGIDLSNEGEAKPKTEKEAYEERLNELLLTNFNDSNVRLCSGPLLLENGDQDVHNNILFTLYSNMSMCYI